jgi:hypothetical protein
LHNIDSQEIVWSKPENNAQKIGVERCSVKNLGAKPSLLEDEVGPVKIDGRIHAGDAIVRVVERIRIEIYPFENESKE